VLLTGSPDGAVLDPPFVVPAAFLYALGAQLPSQVDARQRFAMARADAESKLLLGHLTGWPGHPPSCRHGLAEAALAGLPVPLPTPLVPTSACDQFRTYFE
jgi:hypothetical protein